MPRLGGRQCPLLFPSHSDFLFNGRLFYGGPSGAANSCRSSQHHLSTIVPLAECAAGLPCLSKFCVDADRRGRLPPAKSALRLRIGGTTVSRPTDDGAERH